MSWCAPAESHIAGAAPPDPALVSTLERFARDESGSAEQLPWTARLGDSDLKRLRSDLRLVLSEPTITGEALDWREVQDILDEYSGAVDWNGELLAVPVTPLLDAPYRVDLRSDDRDALESASSAVRLAAQDALSRFLPFHPTSAARLERGRLKKLANRDVWQIDLPDGYRLRFFVAEPERTVHVVYLGPHPDGTADGREQAIRAGVQRRRHGG